MLEPPLTRPIGAAAVAAMLYCLTIPPYPSWLSWVRLLFGLFAGIAGITMVITLADYIFYRASWHIESVTLAWSSAQVRFAEAVARMSPQQLEILEAGGVVRLRPGPGEPGQINWMVVTPEMDIPLWWVREFVDLCEGSFPDLPRQHGLPDNVERARRRAFTKMVCAEPWHIASWENGDGAEWLLPSMVSVRDALGM